MVIQRCILCDGEGIITHDNKPRVCNGCGGKGWVEVGRNDYWFPPYVGTFWYNCSVSYYFPTITVNTQ